MSSRLKRTFFSAKLSADELLKLSECIYLRLSVKSTSLITGLSPQTVILWQKRAFRVAEKWIDEVYLSFSDASGMVIGPEQHKKAGLSFGTLCVCIGYDEKKTMFSRLMKAGKVDYLGIECCFSGRMDKATLLVHDADKSHRTLVKSKGLKEIVIKSYPKTNDSLKAMEPINNYSALLVNEMRKHPGTKATHLNERLCFISCKAMLNAHYGEMSGAQILLSEIIKSEKTVKFEKYEDKGAV